jgi:hypothetical protein
VVGPELTLGAVARARAAARKVVWARRAELTGEALSACEGGGSSPARLVIDLDASIVICHSEKEQAARTSWWVRGRAPVVAGSAMNPSVVGGDGSKVTWQQAQYTQSCPASSAAPTAIT